MIIVLGAQGFVGAAVLSALRQLDTCLGVDLDNYAACKGQPCDVLVNVNGNSKKFLADEDPAREFELSVLSVVRSLQDFPAKKHVLISTVDVYTAFADPADTAEVVALDPARQSRYGFHKWLAEQYVRTTCADWLITRLGGMVGPGMKKSPVFDLVHDVPLRVHLDSQFQYIHTHEVGRIVCELLQRGATHEIFNVCGSGVIALRAIRDLLGKTGQEQSALPRQFYEVNNAKLRALTHVPATRDSVLRFLREEGLLP